MVEEKVDVIEGNEEEGVDERDVDDEDDGEGKTMGREFGGLESQRMELPSAPNCSSAGSCCKLIRGARGEP